MIELTGNNVVLVGIVAVIGLAALVVAGILVREVLAASEGTERMKEIGAAVQEGAAAYLNRQFKTLSIFAVVVFFLLFLLPAETNTERIGRSLFFLVGAVFSGITGYMGMWLAVRGNVRVAAAAKDAGEQRAMRIAFRTGGVAGMFTVGLGLFGAALVVLVYAGEAPKVLEGFGFGARFFSGCAEGSGIFVISSYFTTALPPSSFSITTSRLSRLCSTTTPLPRLDSIRFPRPGSILRASV